MDECVNDLEDDISKLNLKDEVSVLTICINALYTSVMKSINKTNVLDTIRKLSSLYDQLVNISYIASTFIFDIIFRFTNLNHQLLWMLILRRIG